MNPCIHYIHSSILNANLDFYLIQGSIAPLLSSSLFLTVTQFASKAYQWCLWVWPMPGSPRQGTLDPLSGVDPAESPLSIRSVYVLVVVVLSAWVLGAALRLSVEFAGWWVRWAMAVLSSGVLGGTCILGGAEGRDRPAAWSINTEVTEERDGVISDMSA